MIPPVVTLFVKYGLPERACSVRCSDGSRIMVDRMVLFGATGDLTVGSCYPAWLG
jgi:hypothetical protein